MAALTRPDFRGCQEHFANTNIHRAFVISNDEKVMESLKKWGPEKNRGGASEKEQVE